MISPTGHYEPLAREGLPFVLPLLAVSLPAWWFGFHWVSLIFLLLTVCVGLFFRNPERHPPMEDGVILSPADGVVMVIKDDGGSANLDEHPVRRISIFMSVFDVHVNRWPISGTVTKISYVPGKFLDARDPQSSDVNEHNALVVQGDRIAIEVVQIAGIIARRIACWVREGDMAIQGARFGLIRFGSRLDVYLPHHCTPTVIIGTRVRAGETIIARCTTGAEKTAPSAEIL